MQYTPIDEKEYDIANYLLSKCREAGEPITNLKLQKLLYYAQAWHLVLFNKELFCEDFQAWVHGPVLLSQYHRFKDNQWRPIMDEVDKPSLTKAEEKFLDKIIEVFGCETPIALEQMTHNELPWIEARANLPAHKPSNAKIKKATMKSYYKALSDGKNQKAKASGK